MHFQYLQVGKNRYEEGVKTVLTLVAGKDKSPRTSIIFLKLALKMCEGKHQIRVWEFGLDVDSVTQVGSINNVSPLFTNSPERPLRAKLHQHGMQKLHR